MERRLNLMQSPHASTARPLMSVPEPQLPRAASGEAPARPELTALLWCYALAAAFALLLAHAAH